MNSTLRIVLPALAALGLLALLGIWGGVDPAEVWRTLRSLPVWFFFAALGTHFSVYCARSQRFRILIPKRDRPPFWSMMAVSASHNLASYVLPAKSGEATLVIYLKTVCGVPGSAGLASLIVSRLYDFTIMCAALGGSTLWLSRSPHWTPPDWVGMALAVGFFASSGLFLALALRGEHVIKPLRLALHALRLDHTRPGEKLLDLFSRTADALKVARAGARKRLLFPLTAYIWLGVFGFYAMLSRGFGLPEHIGLSEATFASGLAVMSNVLPINAFAGIGTQETGWVLGYGILGVDRESAFATGLAVHLVQIFNVAAMGLVGHLAMGMLPKRQRSPAGQAGFAEGGE